LPKYINRITEQREGVVSCRCAGYCFAGLWNDCRAYECKIDSGYGI